MASFKSAAILVWLWPGEKASIETFQQLRDEDMPESKGYWELGAALIASRPVRDDGKEPWIKVDEAVLAPAECLQAYERFKNAQPF